MIKPAKSKSSATTRKPITANPTVLFFSIILIATMFVILISLPISFKAVRLVDVLTAKAFAAIWTVFGFEIKVDGISVSLRMMGTAKNILIGYGCDGVLAYLILTSAIIPFPCGIYLKLVGMITGLIFVFIINQIRLMGLILILFKLRDTSNFAFYHTVVGQIFALVMVFIFWSYWASKVVEIEKRRAAAQDYRDVE